jgi:hypothetical protein
MYLNLNIENGIVIVFYHKTLLMILKCIVT